MFANLRLARVAAVATALLIPTVSGLGTAAYADDEYGVASTHDALIRQSAASAPSFSGAVALALGQKPNATLAKSAARTASDAPAAAKQDLLGTGGKQDDLAREIYHPGSHTDW
jgi:hypothetical protein